VKVGDKEERRLSQSIRNERNGCTIEEEDVQARGRRAVSETKGIWVSFEGEGRGFLKPKKKRGVNDNAERIPRKTSTKKKNTSAPKKTQAGHQQKKPIKRPYERGGSKLQG